MGYRDDLENEGSALALAVAAAMEELNANKAEDSAVLHKTGPETKDGDLTLNDHFLPKAGIFAIDSMSRVLLPKGGTKSGGIGPNAVGVWKIKLPWDFTNANNYYLRVNTTSLNGLGSTTYLIGGSTSNTTNNFGSAIILGNSDVNDLPVRLGYDTGNYYVYIGDLTTVWHYPTLSIDYCLSSQTLSAVMNPMEVEFVTSFGTITQTIQSSFPYGDWMKLKGKPNNLALLTDIPSLSGYALESWVLQKIADLVDSSPAALDTLNEIAAALGDDPNFSATILNLLAGKFDKTGGEMTGDLSVIGSVLAKNSGNAAAYTINDNGNFPRATFVVAGDGSITNAGFWIVPDSDTNTPTFIEVMDTKTTNPTTNRVWMRAGVVSEIKTSKLNGNYAGGDLNIYTTPNTNQLYLKNNGNVGIGKNDPATKLDVNGVITATGGNSTQWNGKKDGFTVLPVSEGGTGKTSIGEGKVLVGNASGGFDEVGLAGQMLSTSVEITSTMLYAALNDPVDLIAAPGAGKGIDVVRILIAYKSNGTDYSDGDYEIGYDGGRGVHSDKFDKYTAGYVENAIASDGQISPNTKVVFRLNFANSVPTAGNGDFVIKVYYRIESF